MSITHKKSPTKKECPAQGSGGILKKASCIWKNTTLFCSMAAIVLIGMIFIILAIAAILQTSRIDPQAPGSEHILFQDDAIPANLALIVLSALLFIAVMRKNIHLSKVNPRFVIFVMLIVTTVIPLVWINLTQVIPVTGSEADYILTSAREASQNQYNRISEAYFEGHSYFAYYPERLGVVFFGELLCRVFGSDCSILVFQIPNVIALNFAFVGLVMIAHRLFRRRSVTNITAIALALCLQPMFFTTAVNGVLPGLAFTVWGVWFTIRYMQDDTMWCAGIAALLATLATVMQSRFIIVAVAIAIALILHATTLKRLIGLAVAAVMLVGSFGVPKLIAVMYGSRSDTDLEPGVSFTLNRYVGIGKSDMSPGWFNANALQTLALNGMDRDAADEAAREGIDQRLDELKQDEELNLSEYFKQKFLSQFNEPFMQSLWVSQISDHEYYHASPKEAPKLVTSVYTGGLFMLLGHWFNYYNMMIYIGFAAGMVWIILKRKESPWMSILPTALFGAVLYLTLGEAKSQFFLPFFVMLIPFAMYGLLETTAVIKKYTGFLFALKGENKEKPQNDATVRREVKRGS